MVLRSVPRSPDREWANLFPDMDGPGEPDSILTTCLLAVSRECTLIRLWISLLLLPQLVCCPRPLPSHLRRPLLQY